MVANEPIPIQEALDSDQLTSFLFEILIFPKN